MPLLLMPLDFLQQLLYPHHQASAMSCKAVYQVQISTNVVVNSLCKPRKCIMHTQCRAGPDILQYHTTGKQPQSKGVII